MAGGFFKKIRIEPVLFLYLLFRINRPSVTISPPVVLRFAVVAAAAGVFAWAAGAAARAAGERSKNAAMFLAAMFLVSYAGSPVLQLDTWYLDNAVFMNAAVVLLTMACFSFTGKPRTKWRIPVVCFACAALQPSFVVTYLPMLMVLAFCGDTVGNEAKITAGKNKGKAKAKAKIKIKATEKPEARLLPAAACAISSAAAYFLFSRKAGLFGPAQPGAWQLLALSAAVVLPALVLFPILWAGAAREDKAFRLKAALIALLPLISVASPFIRTGEYRANLVSAAVFAQTGFALYFFGVNNNAVRSSAEKIENFFIKNPSAAYFILIYLSLFSVLSKFNRLEFFWN